MEKPSKKGGLAREEGGLEDNQRREPLDGGEGAAEGGQLGLQGGGLLVYRIGAGLRCRSPSGCLLRFLGQRPSLPLQCACFCLLTCRRQLCGRVVVQLQFTSISFFPFSLFFFNPFSLPFVFYLFFFLFPPFFLGGGGRREEGGRGEAR